MEKERIILHVDLNNFYASVECMLDPMLKNVPLAVGGSEEDRHGIILASNYIAKSYGVKTAQTLREAYDLCPNLLVLPPSYKEYMYYSKKVKHILSCYSDYIESFGIDEAWIDVTNSTLLFGDKEHIAESIRYRIKDELGLTVSIGVSFNKVFAKLGSDYKKPDAITIITKDNFKEIVHPLPVSDLLYVGKATTEHLNKLGIYTIGDLANTDKEYLKRHLGKNGVMLYYFANGYDNSPVSHINDVRQVKSIGNSITTKSDLNNLHEAKIVLYVLSESVAARLKLDNSKGYTIQINYRNTQLKTYTRQKKLTKPTNISKEIAKAAVELLNVNYDFELPLRSIGVSVTNLLTNDTCIQMDMFDEYAEREEESNLDNTIQYIRNKYGFDSIKRTSMLTDETLTNFNPKDDHVIFPVSFRK